MAKTIKSRKAKGRQLCNELRNMILETYPQLKEEDVVVTPAGVNGTDIQLSHEARQVFPYAVECKNGERLKLWKALLQAHTNRQPGLAPLLVFRRNYSRTYACLEINTFLRLISGKDVVSNGDKR